MKYQFKGFTSLLLAMTFLIMALSGVILYFSPRGGSASWIDWLTFGLRKPAWEAIHVNVCLLFLIVAVLHLILNWSTFWHYVKKACGFGLSMKTEMLVAAVLSVIVVTGTVYQLPPFSTIKGYGEHRGPPEGRGPGFGRGFGQGEGNRMDDAGPDQGRDRQGRGSGRGGGNRDN